MIGTGTVKIEFIRRLGADWRELSIILDIPAYQQARFRPGDEAVEIWDRLERQHKLHRLPDALNSINRPDLAELVSAVATSRPASVQPGHRAPGKANRKTLVLTAAMALAVATGALVTAIGTGAFRDSRENSVQSTPSTPESSSAVSALTIADPLEGRVLGQWHKVKVRPLPPAGRRLLALVHALNNPEWHVVRCEGQEKDMVICSGVAMGDVNSTGVFEVMIVAVTPERAAELAPPGEEDPIFSGSLRDLGDLDRSRAYSYIR